MNIDNTGHKMQILMKTPAVITTQNNSQNKWPITTAHTLANPAIYNDISNSSDITTHAL